MGLTGQMTDFLFQLSVGARENIARSVNLPSLQAAEAFATSLLAEALLLQAPLNAGVDTWRVGVSDSEGQPRFDIVTLLVRKAADPGRERVVMRYAEGEPLPAAFASGSEEAVLAVPVISALNVLMMLNTALDDTAMAPGTRDCVVTARDAVAKMVEASRDG